MNIEQTREVLSATVSQLRSFVPLISPYFDIQVPLREYADRLHSTDVRPEHEARQASAARSANHVLRATFGEQADSPRVRPSDLRAVNIVDHHQLLNHPLLLGTNIIANAGRLQGRGALRPIVAFSCSNIAPSNAYMRNGFQLRGQPVAYFSAKEYRDVVYYMGRRKFDFVERLQGTRRWGSFAPPDQEYLIEYQAFLNALDFSQCRGHKDQIAVALRATWPLLFSPELRKELPELLYVNWEEWARHYLIELLSENCFIADALFEDAFRESVLAQFRGVVIAWNERAGTGTHFFWRRRPASQKLLRMYVNQGELQPVDSRFQSCSVPLEREAILEHLRDEKLLPAISLCTTLLLYAGIKPLVGPGSLVYVTAFKEGWSTLLAARGQDREADLLRGADVSGLIAGTPIFFERASDGPKAQYAADVLQQGGVGAEYLTRVFDLSFGDLLSVGAGGIYSLFANSYIPKEQQLIRGISLDEAASVVHDWI